MNWSELQCQLQTSCLDMLKHLFENEPRATSLTTHRLQPSPSTLQLTRSYTSDIPGLPFGVSVALVAVNGSNLPPTPLTVTLSPAPTNTTPGLLFDAACATTSSCSISSSTDAASAAASYAACQLSLPCTGTFQLTACPSSSHSQNVSSGGSSIPCASVQLGRNASSWQQMPWTTQAAPVLTADQTMYVLPTSGGNSTAQLSFQNPWGSASALLILSSATGYMSVQEEQVQGCLGWFGVQDCDDFVQGFDGFDNGFQLSHFCLPHFNTGSRESN